MSYPNRMTFSGVVRNGVRIYFDDMASKKRSAFLRAHDGRQFIETIEAVKDAKTIQQLAFFHGPLLKAFMEITGSASKSAVKQHLKREFLGRKEVVRGEEEVITPSLSELSKQNMRDFIENCLNLLYELGGDLTLEGRNEYEEIARRE